MYVTHLGTMTSRVVRYSESRMKCSFLTKSARFLVSRLPLQSAEYYMNIYNVKILIYRHLRLLLFQVLQISLEVVIGLRLGLQIAIDLTDLLGDNVGDVAQRLLDRILGHVPLEAGQVLG